MHYNQLHYSEKLEELIQVSLTCDDLEMITEKAAIFLGNPLVIISPLFRILSFSNANAPDDAIWKNAVKRGFITLEFGTALNNWEVLKDKESLPEQINVTTISPLRRRFFKLTYENKLIGYLNVTENQTSLEEKSASDYQIVLDILAKQIAISRFRQHRSDTILDEEFLLSLLNKEYVNRVHFQENIVQTTFSQEMEYILLCGHIQVHDWYDADKDGFREELQAAFPQGTIVIDNLILNILIPAIIYKNQTKIIEKYLKKHHLTLGASNPFYDLYNIQNAQHQAIYALDHPVPRLLSQRIFHYEYVAVNDFLEKVPKGEYTCPSEDVLKMHQYDLRNETQYVETLYYYLILNKSIKDTASTMYLHRNTITYRIRKMSEEFNIPLTDPFRYASLLISCIMVQNY